MTDEHSKSYRISDMIRRTQDIAREIGSMSNNGPIVEVTCTLAIHRALVSAVDYMIALQSTVHTREQREKAKGGSSTQTIH